MPDPADKEMLFLILRLLSVGGLLASLLAGAFLYRKREAWFGVHADMPSENASSLGYNKFQAVAIWVHLVVMFAMFALLLH